MNRWIAAIALLAGCDKLFGLEQIKADAAAGDDASVDAKVFLDAPPAGTVCAGGTNGGPLHVCAQMATLQVRTFPSSFDIDTGIDASCDRVIPSDGRQQALCALIASDIVISPGATITAHGTRPLVLVAMGTLTVEGVVDVSSHVAGITGASANDAACAVTNGGAPQQAAASTSGGGAGGSFGSVGGDGGPPGGNGTATRADAAIDPTTLTLVRGGCQGGPGGQDHDGHIALGGASGGAVYLMATTKITVSNGKILANGAPGGGGASFNAADFPGGAGGGTGGLIMLDSPGIQLTSATVMANGGGGGGGQGDGTTNGTAGVEPNPMTPYIAASGGSGGTGGGAGGAGSSLAAPAAGGGGSMGTVNGAAGGGGGGAGVIRMFGPLTMSTSKIAPLPS